ncbi:hypothetical protein [Rubritalea tangerina]
MASISYSMNLSARPKQFSLPAGKSSKSGVSESLHLSIICTSL